MGDGDIERDTLRYAVAIAGNEHELARRLRVSVRQVGNWLAGADRVPERIFQAALDVVIASSPRAIVRSRTILERIAR